MRKLIEIKEMPNGYLELYRDENGDLWQRFAVVSYYSKISPVSYIEAKKFEKELARKNKAQG